MRQFKFGSALLMTMILVGCGGGGSDVPAKPKFSAQVSFGDSLSDVGSYKVGVVAKLGGGQFTINAASAVPATPTNWTEMTALKFGLTAPCAAETGLDDGTAGAVPATVGVSYVMPPVVHAGCTSYAQGGARVTSQPGIGNAALGGIALTVPVHDQITNHLATLTATSGKFTGKEIVYVMAGANDVFFQIAILTPGATAAATAAVTAAVPAQILVDINNGTCIPADAQASNCIPAAVAELTPTVGAAAADNYIGANSAGAVPALHQAAVGLVNDVGTLILGNGAKYVTAVNIPDIGSTPAAASMGPKTKTLVNSMVSEFNSTLKSGLDALPGNADVLFVDAYTASKDEVANPAKYNLTNVTGTACNLSYGVNALATPTALGSSLVCNANNLNQNVLPTDHYLFADTVHPTPYGQSLFALYVLQAMTNKGWY
jgi:outer membrane lipase/esterase